MLRDVLLFALLGLGAGSIHAASAMGIVLVSRASGVVNVAASVLGAYGAYAFAELRRSGDLVLPTIGFDARIPLGGPLSAVPALAIAAFVSALLFALVERAVFAPLARRGTDDNVTLVAGIGILLVGQALLARRFTAAATVVPSVFGSGGFRFGSGIVPYGRMWLVAAVIVVAFAVAFGLRRTVVGRAVGVASTEGELLAVLGFPVDRLRTLTWAATGAVTSTLMILAAPTLTPQSAALGVVPALAAALVGRLSAIHVTVMAALGIGVVQSELSWMRAQGWYPDWAKVGLAETVPLVVILAALFLGRVPTADAQPVPVLRGGAWRWTPLALGALGMLGIAATSGRVRFALISSMISALIALSYVVMSGQAGLVGLGQTAVAGLAAFAVARVGTTIPFPISTLIAVLVAVGLGLVFTLPTLRVRGPALIAASLAAAVAVEQLVLRNPVINAIAGNALPAPVLFGLDLSVRRGRNTARVEFALLVLSCLVVTAVLVGSLVRSGAGRRLRAVHSDTDAAEASGLDSVRLRAGAVVIACAIAGLAGALGAYSRGQVSPDAYGLLVAFGWLAIAQVAGVGRVEAAVVGALFAPAGIIATVADQQFGVGGAWTLGLGLALVLVTSARIVVVPRWRKGSA